AGHAGGGRRLHALGGDDLPTLVVAAVRTHVVWRLGFPALGAGRQGRGGQLVVRPALAPPGPRVAALRQRHRSAPIGGAGAPRAVPAGDPSPASGTGTR